MRRAVASLVALALLLAAACGGGSRDDGTGATSVANRKATTATAATPAPMTMETPGTQATAVSSGQRETKTDGGALVELADFVVRAGRSVVPAGDVTFRVTNTGRTPHNMLIIKTDLDPAALPTDEFDSSVDEAADSIDVVDEVFELGPGEEDTITTTLESGAYVLVCNVVDDAGAHYQLGMRTPFTVHS